MSSRNSVLAVSEILRLFVNILTLDEMYSLSLRKSECLMQTTQMQLSRNRKRFAQFFLHFQNVHKIFNTFEKKMSFRDYLFLKL